MNITSLNSPSMTSPAVNNPASGNSSLSNFVKTPSADQGGLHQAAEAASSGSSSLADKRQAALQIVNRTLTLAYETINSKAQAASAEYEAFEPLTAEKVANNILGFIERRLQMDIAEGADQKALQERLEAGLSGFKKGFAEASEKLEALSLVSPEIQSDIDKTYDLVLKGVDDLRSKFIQSAAGDAENLTSGEPAKIVTSSGTKEPANKLDLPNFLPATHTHVGYGNYEYGRAREFSFELTTKEGDKITIKASSSEGLAIEAARGKNSVSEVKVSYSASESFSLSVEGELSDEELGAINDLLGRVNNLASEFFNGDIDLAFEQAMNLGYDAQQIARFSLNLAQAEIQQVTQAYQAFEPHQTGASDNRPQLLVDQLLPLGNFIKDLIASVDRASEFSEPKRLISDLADAMPSGGTAVDQQPAKRFRDFIEQLFTLELG